MKHWSLGKVIVYIILFLLAASMILPFIRVVSLSISSRISVESNYVRFFPKDITFDSYRFVLSEQRIWDALKINIFVAAFGTVLSIIISSTMAFPLSRPEFKARKGIMVFVLLTMVFQAPVIPFFLTVKAYGLLNTVWALILPLTVNAFNLSVMRTFFEDTPESLIDSGRIDGCGDLGLLFRIVIPISKPVLATMALFYAVAYWNIFYNALMFIFDKKLQPLQIIVRSYISESVDTPGLYRNVNYNDTTLQMATILVAILPIIIVYPFLQRYFTAGVMLGAIKE